MSVMLLVSFSCSSLKRDDIKTDLSCRSDMYKILYYASLAGSSHNSQPWKVEVYGGDSLKLYADSARKLSVVDKSQRELYISIGAFIENLTIAAVCLGYKAEISYNEFIERENSLIAYIKFIKSDIIKSDFSLTDIEQRTTLRIPFNTDPINKNDIDKLVNIDSSNIHFIPSSSVEGKFIADNEYEAYTKQSKNEQAKKELADWIRFSNKDALEKLDGLTTAGMGINGFGGFVVRNFYNPEDSKKETFIAKGIEKTKTLTENCGGWIIITNTNDSFINFVYSGMLYERLNLICTKLKIGFHPMNQIIEEEDYEKKINGFLKLNGKIIFAARIGYTDNYSFPVSLRRQVEHFAVFK